MTKKYTRSIFAFSLLVIVCIALSGLYFLNEQARPFRILDNNIEKLGSILNFNRLIINTRVSFDGINTLQSEGILISENIIDENDIVSYEFLHNRDNVKVNYINRNYSEEYTLEDYVNSQILLNLNLPKIFNSSEVTVDSVIREGKEYWKFSLSSSQELKNLASLLITNRLKNILSSDNDNYVQTLKSFNIEIPGDILANFYIDKSNQRIALYDYTINDEFIVAYNVDVKENNFVSKLEGKTTFGSYIEMGFVDAFELLN